MAGNTGMNTKTTTSRDRSIFRFFDLPAELRNEVFDLSLLTESSRKCCLEVAISKMASKNLLLVSRQFASEYQARTHPAITISEWGTDTLEDDLFRTDNERSTSGCPRDALWSPDHALHKLPLPARRIRSLHINLGIFGWLDLRPVEDWLKNIMAGMTGLKSVQRSKEQRVIHRHAHRGYKLAKSLTGHSTRVQRCLLDDFTVS